jgi:hypothetical protein
MNARVFLVLLLCPMAWADLQESKTYKIAVDKHPGTVRQYRFLGGNDIDADQTILAEISSDGKITFPGDPKKAFEELWRLYQKRCDCPVQSNFGGTYFNSTDGLIPR